MKKNIVIIDNFDSFTFNIVNLLKSLGHLSINVFRNNRVKFDFLDRASHIVISPGPGIPCEAGKTLEVIDKYYKSKPILGVCLGHQAIGQYLGFKLVQLDRPAHGVATKIKTTNYDSKLFLGLPTSIEVGRYHSWIIQGQVEDAFTSSVDDDNNIMSIEHKNYPLFGVQFHPESILSTSGAIIMKNFIDN